MAHSACSWSLPVACECGPRGGIGAAEFLAAVVGQVERQPVDLRNCPLSDLTVRSYSAHHRLGRQIFFQNPKEEWDAPRRLRTVHR